MQTKLRSTLQYRLNDAKAKNRAPSIEEITSTNIPYLDATIEEILRCAGTTLGADREAMIDTEILGYKIPKGTLVIMLGVGASMMTPAFEVDETRRSPSCQTALRKNQVFAWKPKDIGAFNPDRWLVGENQDFDARAGPQFAFSLGVRSCFGRKLAYQELRVFFLLLIWHFELLPCPRELSGYGSTVGITNKPKQCYVKLRKMY